VIALALVLLALALPAQAEAQNVVRLAEGVEVMENSSNPARLYGTRGANVFLNTGAIIGPRDIQMGWWGDGSVPSLVNGDIGAGSTEHPGILNLGADVSRTVRLQGAGRTVLATRPTGIDVTGSLQLCDAGCVDVGQALLDLQVRATRAVIGLSRQAAKIRRLQRQVGKLRRRAR
jgi:hypothetical protein